VLVRPAVEAGERLGFLPGDMAQKVDPYLRPLYDALYDLMGLRQKSPSCWNAAPSKSRRLRSCAAHPEATRSSFWMRRKTPRPSK